MPAKILYKNLIQGATITDNGNTSPGSSPKAAAFGRLSTPTIFAPGTTTFNIDFNFNESVLVDFFGIAGHNFEEQNAEQVEIFSSADGISYTSQAVLTLLDYLTLGVAFPEISAQYWRLTFSGSALMVSRNVGNYSLGKALELPRVEAPFKSAGEFQGDDTKRNYSETGGLIASDIYYKPVPVQIVLKNYPEQFVLDNIPELAAYIASETFYFMWNVNRPGEVVYSWITDRVNVPRFNGNYLADWEQRAVGVVSVMGAQ